MLNGKQLLDLSKDWNLDDEPSALVFADFLEERGELEVAECIRRVSKFVKCDDGLKRYCTVSRWIQEVSDAGKSYIAWLCEHWKAWETGTIDRHNNENPCPKYRD